MAYTEIAYERQLGEGSSGGGDSKQPQTGRTATRHLHTGVKGGGVVTGVWLAGS